MTSEPVFLDATLRPNPPMEARTLVLILVIVALFNLAFALTFILHGAWPILPFLGLDIALLGWAFRAVRIAARRFERVTVTHSSLRVEHHSPKGDMHEAEFNPYWVRVDLERPTEVTNRLFLRSHGQSLQIAKFVSPPLRESFAETLKSALLAAKTTRF